MTARVLVVDDLLPNLKLLEARLSAEYFEVLTAANGIDALKICANGDCDIVLPRRTYFATRMAGAVSAAQPQT
jgi:two-component system, cell cycle response regulator